VLVAYVPDVILQQPTRPDVEQPVPAVPIWFVQAVCSAETDVEGRLSYWMHSITLPDVIAHETVDPPVLPPLPLPLVPPLPLPLVPPLPLPVPLHWLAQFFSSHCAKALPELEHVELAASIWHVELAAAEALYDPPGQMQEIYALQLLFTSLSSEPQLDCTHDSHDEPLADARQELAPPLLLLEHANAADAITATAPRIHPLIFIIVLSLSRWTKGQVGWTAYHGGHSRGQRFFDGGARRAPRFHGEGRLGRVAT
jgi:hypothetical protein